MRETTTKQNGMAKANATQRGSFVATHLEPIQATNGSSTPPQTLNARKSQENTLKGNTQYNFVTPTFVTDYTSSRWRK